MFHEWIQPMGTVLALISIASLSIFLGSSGNRDFRDFINSEIRMARLHGALLMLTLFPICITGVSLLISPSLFELHLIVVLILWPILVYIEVHTFYELLKNKHFPSLSRDFANAITYMAVLWLIFERVEISWTFVGVTSTTTLILILYFMVLMNRYLKISTIVVVPVDLYPSAIGARSFSALMGLHMLAYGNWGVFRGFILLGLLVLALSLIYTLVEMRKLIKYV